MVGVVSAPAVVFSIILGNLYVTLLYVSNHDAIFPLLNTWGNFPHGIFTAIFTPDTQVFLGQISWTSWYIVTEVSFLLFLSMFVVLNADQSERELARRSCFFATAIIAVPMVSNFVSLLRGYETVGPSTAVYASQGLVLGFSLFNSIVWIGKGHPRYRDKKRAAAIIASLAFAFSFIAIPLVPPFNFFNVVNKVDWGSHVFCFVVGAGVALLWSLIRRKS